MTSILPTRSVWPLLMFTDLHYKKKEKTKVTKDYVSLLFQKNTMIYQNPGGGRIMSKHKKVETETTR